MDCIISLPRPASTALILTLLLLPRLLSIHAHNTSQTGAPKVPAVIVFGDSIVDPGNNNHLKTIIKCDFPPYGQDFVDGKPTGRFSNGKITTDFIASELGVKEFLPAYSDPELGEHDLLTGVSFASGGTGYDIVTSRLVSVTAMSKQLEMFKEYKEKLKTIVGEKKAASIIAGSLYIVCAGSNDVVSYFSIPFRRLVKDMPSYAQLLMEYASSFAQDLVRLGAKRIGILGIPPIGCLPSQRTLAGGISRDCVADRNQLAQMYNSKISKELQRLTATLQGTQLIYVDIYTTLLDLMQRPQNYGFEESTKGCCGSGSLEVAFLCNSITATTCSNVSSYVFWDSYHPTERAYGIIVHELIRKYIGFLM